MPFLHRFRRPVTPLGSECRCLLCARSPVPESRVRARKKQLHSLTLGADFFWIFLGGIFDYFFFPHSVTFLFFWSVTQLCGARLWAAMGRAK